MKTSVAAIILAAGKGTRMKSETAKVLHQVCGRPMVLYVLDLVAQLSIKRSVVVLGHQASEVKKSLDAKIKTVVQKQLVGTADAVKRALPALAGFSGSVIVLYGDAPLLKKETLEKLIKRHADTGAAATILTAKMDNPHGYGRILRDQYGSICGIVEEKDADDFQKDIKEINTGIVIFCKDKLLKALAKVRPNNAKKEYYLTDTIKILYDAAELVETADTPEPAQALGINSRVELAQANSVMQRRLNEAWMKEGVTIVDPATAFIAYGTKIGQDTVIQPFTVIEKDVIIGKQCSVGPFAHIRPKTELGDNVAVGNFIEISRSKFSSRSRAKHFGFIGDARISRHVNIGAGTVTANYDGKNKNITHIGDDAFIGSDTVIVAPVVIGKNARTGAGSVVTHDVASNGTVVGVPARPFVKK